MQIDYKHTITFLSYFKGLGPRVGLDGNYFINTNFGINTLLSGSLLVGKSSYRTTFYSSGVEQTTGITNVAGFATFANQNQTNIVPELNTQIGLFYKTNIIQSTDLTIQLGYYFQNYFNAVYQDVPTGLVSNLWNEGIIGVTSKAHNLSSLNFNGPYLRLVMR